MKNTITIGNDFVVNRIGLGTNRIGNNQQSQEALKYAVDLGFQFIDTAAAYTSGVSESVIGKTLTPYPEGLVIATKGGMHAPDFRVDSRPEALAHQLEKSLEKLHMSQIPLYFLHRVDQKVPLKESMLFLKQAQEEGKIKHIGLSEVTVEQIKEAQQYAQIAAVENEYNLMERKYEAVVAYCEASDIVFVPWFPLGRGNFSPFTPTLEKLANKYSTTSMQIALAWLLKRSPIILPIPGSLSPEHLKENFQSLQIDLSSEDFSSLQR